MNKIISYSTFLIIFILIGITSFAQKSIEDIDKLCESEYIVKDKHIRNVHGATWPVVGIYKEDITVYYNIAEPYYDERVYKINIRSSVSAVRWSETFYYNDLQELLFYTYASTDEYGDTITASYEVKNNSLSLLKAVNKENIEVNYFIDFEDQYEEVISQSRHCLTIACALWSCKPMEERTKDIRHMYYATNANIDNYRVQNFRIEDPALSGIIQFWFDSSDNCVKIKSELMQEDETILKEWYFDEKDLYFAFYSKTDNSTKKTREDRFYFQGKLYKHIDENKNVYGIDTDFEEFIFRGDDVKTEAWDLYDTYYEE